MTIIVETGAIVAGAESYASVADADTYHANRGNAAWAALATPAREVALRLATDYMEQIYRDQWKGYRTSLTQALSWPRVGVVRDSVAYSNTAGYTIPPTMVPVEVVNACCALALKSTAGELAPDLKRTVAEKTVGPIKTVYAPGAPEHVRFRAVDLMLKPLMVAKLQMVRA